MRKGLLAGAAASLLIAASPAFSQSTPKPEPGAQPMPMPMGPAAAQPGIGQPAMSQPPGAPEAFRSVPESAAERAQAHRDWAEMTREWQQRQRNGGAGTGSSMGAPTPGLAPGLGAGAYGSGETRIMPSQPSAQTAMPMRGTGLRGTSDVPMSPAERAQARRDWNDVSREWQQRQRTGGVTPPSDPGQPPLPYQR
jgi:hypothetical protein